MSRPVLTLVTADYVAPSVAAKTPELYRPDYTPSVGAKYEDGLGTKEIAVRIRADIKAAQKSGTLPMGLKVSVRIDSYSMGFSIDARVTGLPEGFQIGYLGDVEDSRRDGIRKPWLTRSAFMILDELESIVGAYQRSVSDSQTDYYCTNYHSSVDFAGSVEKAERERLAALEAMGRGFAAVGAVL